jgi:parallel beta-helix repeat protein
VGNIINITGGSGFTTGRYQINSVAGSTATMDRAVGTASSTGGAGKLGGALATIATAVAGMVSRNWIWIKAGTYTFTAKISINIQYVQMVGYGSTHGDEGTKPLITTATNSTQLFDITHGSDPKFLFSNLSLSNTAGTRAQGITNSNGNTTLSLVVINCDFVGFNYGIAMAGTTFPGFNQKQAYLINCSFKNCTNTGVSSGGPMVVQECSFISCTTIGIRLNASDQFMNQIRGCLIVSCGFGIQADNTQNTVVIGCTLASNTGSGIYLNASNYNDYPLSVFFENNILYGNTRYGVEVNSSGPTTPGVGNKYTKNNAFGSNTLGNYFRFPSDTTDIALSANPFTASGSGDYSLNNTAGGGELCRSAGHPNPFPGT